MKWNFLYEITAASRTPDLGATAPRSPFSLPSVLNWISWIPPNKIPGYPTDKNYISKGSMKVNKTVLCHAYKFQTWIFNVIFQAECGAFSFDEHDCILDNVQCIRL